MAITTPYKRMGPRRRLWFGAGVVGVVIVCVAVLAGAGVLHLFSEKNTAASQQESVSTPTLSPTLAPITAPTTAPTLVPTPAPTPAPTPTNDTRPSVMLIGDSLTQLFLKHDKDGWGALLQQHYDDSLQFVERAWSGMNSNKFITYGLPNVTRDLKAEVKPVIITLWFGANDASPVNGTAKRFHVPIEKYKANLIQSLKEFQTISPASKLILITPPAVDEYGRNLFVGNLKEGKPSNLQDRSNEEVGKYAAVCGEVAAAVPGVTLVDVYTNMMTQYPNVTERATLFYDGLHFSDSGNRLVYEQLLSTIESLLSVGV